MFDPSPLRCPGLFVTGTDTGVGKTVVTCAVAAALRRQGMARVGVCKPLATGCRRDREGLVSEDAEALAHFSDCRQPLDVINPIRMTDPLAPAMAAAVKGLAPDWPALAHALSRLDAASDALLVEGVGGLLVPLDPRQPTYCVLDLAAAIGYPAVVVARATLGTINHTAMTVELLRRRGLRLAGVVINGYDADRLAADPSITLNRQWIQTVCGTQVLAVVPQAEEGAVAPHEGRIAGAVLDAVAMVRWEDHLGPAQPV